MLPVLISHSHDLARLQGEGYQIEVSGGYLVVHHIPYVNSQRTIKYGKLICVLSSNAGKTITPSDHVMYFEGEHPCNADGSIIEAIQHGSNNQRFTESVTVDHSFSNKPKGGYADYYEKVFTYATIISSQAKAIDPSVTDRTFIKMAEPGEQSVFNYPDTNATRAKIAMVNSKLENQKIAIIGLGGTGSYVLDLLAKVPVQEIHLFDDDLFLQHNAFRAPGAPTIEELSAAPLKVDYFHAIYSRMHKSIVAHPTKITPENKEQLSSFHFVFICVDKNAVRGMLIQYLLSIGIPFIDCGIGVEVVDDMLIGAARITVGSSHMAEHIPLRVGFDDADDDVYASNIQIADLNMLNAFMAVHKWKKLRGFYQDLIQENNAIYTINTAQLDATDSAA